MFTENIGISRILEGRELPCGNLANVFIISIRKALLV